MAGEWQACSGRNGGNADQEQRKAADVSRYTVRVTNAAGSATGPPAVVLSQANIKQ